MAFALLIVGVFLLVSAVRGTQDDLFALVQGDFTGTNNFVYWFIAIMVIGALGYIPKVKPISVGLLTLVVLVLVLTKGNPSGVGGGLFAQLTAGLKTTTKVAPAGAPAPAGQPFGDLTAVEPTPGLNPITALGQLPPITGTIQ